jgi:hypothetical protein
MGNVALPGHGGCGAVIESRKGPSLWAEPPQVPFRFYLQSPPSPSAQRVPGDSLGWPKHSNLRPRQAGRAVQTAAFITCWAHGILSLEFLLFLLGFGFLNVTSLVSFCIQGTQK